MIWRWDRDRGLRVAVVAVLLWLAVAGLASAHEVGGRDAAFVRTVTGPEPFPFLYLGAKHMVTGYDHLLFLVGVVFLLTRPRDVLIYVSLFSLGHSITLLLGVLGGFGVNGALVDAIIGLSVVYKGFDNLNGFTRLLGWRPDPRLMTFEFGLVHGLGLADKLRDLDLPDHGLITNLLSFNLGVEVGQVLALMVVLLGLGLARRWKGFDRASATINWGLMTAGFTLAGACLITFFNGGQG